DDEAVERALLEEVEDGSVALHGPLRALDVRVAVAREGEQTVHSEEQRKGGDTPASAEKPSPRAQTGSKIGELPIAVVITAGGAVRSADTWGRRSRWPARSRPMTGIVADHRRRRR